MSGKVVTVTNAAETSKERGALSRLSNLTTSRWTLELVE